ncbi:MAG: amidohydrolase family protein [Saprospiraceae bacterium]
MTKYTADYIYTCVGAPIQKQVITIDSEGKILSIDNIANHDISTVKRLNGIITPGFINTHCHLELSHMKGLLNTGTGLLPFIRDVVKFRDFPQEEIMNAIELADQEMYDNGIVAVGDISNKVDTAKTKIKSDIQYYTFVEMFDFMQTAMTDDTIDNYKSVFAAHDENNGNRKCYVPHAPYTVSEGIFEYIRNENYQEDTVSIHNQETHAENQLFLTKEGDFIGFYKDFEFSIDRFKATGQTSIHYPMQFLNAMQKTLFVHNTMTTKEDIESALNWNYRSYWATCPNANLYIENRLPDYQAFIDTEAKMTIGTDSLTSNWQLSILEEMKTIKKFKSFVPLETLINWACINGAEALGYENTLGTIEVGKTPGLVHINATIDCNNEPNISNAVAKRLN